MDRRTFMAYSAISLAGLAVQWATVEPAHLFSVLGGERVDRELVAWLEETSGRLAALPTEQRRHTVRLLDAHLATTPCPVPGTPPPGRCCSCAGPGPTPPWATGPPVIAICRRPSPPWRPGRKIPPRAGARAGARLRALPPGSRRSRVPGTAQGEVNGVQEHRRHGPGTP
nr:hypothetical protein [Streptomyces lavendulae]